MLSNLVLNNDNDNTEISVAEAEAYTGAIDVRRLNIASVEGIEAFVNLTILNCGINPLTNLDVSKNTALTMLGCHNSSISSLDVSKNTALTILYCQETSLTSIDVSANTALTQFECDNSPISEINISTNTALTSFACNSTNISKLDLTTNTNIKYLYSQSNPNLSCIQALDIQDKTFWKKDLITTYNENCNYITDIVDVQVAPAKTIASVYNLQGQKVNTNTQGLVIIRYTDGTSEKVMQ